MFRKSIISAAAVAALAVATALSGTTAASAGGYGYGHGKGHGYGHGYGKGHGYGHGHWHRYGHGHHKRLIIKTPQHGYWKQHVSWCHDRYRSYRDWDNTFRPYHGPRQKCRSPYYRG